MTVTMLLEEDSISAKNRIVILLYRCGFTSFDSTTPATAYVWFKSTKFYYRNYATISVAQIMSVLVLYL